MTPKAEHFDVVIVGAGLSGVGAAYHLQAISYDSAGAKSSIQVAPVLMP